MDMNDTLLQNIKEAMKSNPDLSLLGLIEFVCNRSFPTRVIEEDKLLNRECEKWKLTNSDILKAFQKYNATKML